MKKNLELDSGPNSKYAHKYFSDPYQYIAIPFAFLNIKPNTITYFRAFLFCFSLYSQHLLIQNILYLFYWQLYFVKF